MTDSTFNARRFITAGRAVFTLQGRDARYTFRVTRANFDVTQLLPRRSDPRRLGPAYFVSLLTGSDNTSDYTYVGVLDTKTGYVRLTAASHYTAESTPVIALRWALPIVWKGGILPVPARLMHVGRCGRCGRALTVPESILAGIGPECATKL